MPEGLQIYQKETPVQVFSCELCDIFKNTFFAKHLRATASARCFLTTITLFVTGILLQLHKLNNLLNKQQASRKSNSGIFFHFFFYSLTCCELHCLTPSRHTTSFQRLYDVYTTSYRRRIDVETTSCVYWARRIWFLRYG